jgi:cell division protein FtsZ
MVRPGLINLDFADVETVMSSMGKAMMGSGEAEGENRALAATELALNNPLIDDYSLKGAKGLLVNITGGEDIKLFEVDQAVNKIRAEVDPEAELIFGAIKDDNLDGKMRVSVVATALDGEVLEPRSVVNMVHRIHNRNSGYSDNLTKKDNIPEMPNLDSIQGATALKLDNQVEENKNDLVLDKQNEIRDESIKNDDPMFSGLSLDNASYFENSLDQSQDAISVFDEKSEDNTTETNNNDDLDPQLFSDEDSFNNSSESNDQEISKNEDEEDFEIPAFLRKQKF